MIIALAGWRYSTPAGMGLDHPACNTFQDTICVCRSVATSEYTQKVYLTSHTQRSLQHPCLLRRLSCLSCCRVAFYHHHYQVQSSAHVMEHRTGFATVVARNHQGVKLTAHWNTRGGAMLPGTTIWCHTSCVASYCSMGAAIVLASFMKPPIANSCNCQQHGFITSSFQPLGSPC